MWQRQQQWLRVSENRPNKVLMARAEVGQLLQL